MNSITPITQITQITPTIPIYRREPGATLRRSRTVAALLACTMLAGCSSCRGRPPAPILTWHAISDDGAPAGDDDDGWSVPQRQFLAQLDALSGAGFKTISLGALLDHTDRGTPLPPRAIVLTFDDGTEDHQGHVLLALQAHGMRATFFLVAGKIADDEAHRVEEKTPAGRVIRYLIWPEVRALRDAGMEIGAHGLTHARLPDLTDAAALDELVRARAVIGAALGAPPELMAWPFNSVRARTRELAKQAGYRAAAAGVVHGGSDRYSLYRIPVKASTDPVALVESLR